MEYERARYDGNRLKAALLLADQGILNDIRSNPERESMGSTVVPAWSTGDRVTLVHVGDSRAYLLNPWASSRSPGIIPGWRSRWPTAS